MVSMPHRAQQRLRVAAGGVCQPSTAVEDGLPACQPCPSRSWVQLLASGTRDEVAIFPTYFPGYYLYTLSGCTVGSVEWMPPADPCDWTSESRMGMRMAATTFF